MPKKMVADEMMVVMWMLDRCSLFMPSDSEASLFSWF